MTSLPFINSVDSSAILGVIRLRLVGHIPQQESLGIILARLFGQIIPLGWSHSRMGITDHSNLHAGMIILIPESK